MIKRKLKLGDNDHEVLIAKNPHKEERNEIRICFELLAKK
jgi:hypothetical protein